MVTHFYNSTNDGPTRATKWDNATLYDRNAFYHSLEVVEEFSYDEHNSLSNMLHGQNRGGGFTNAWIEDTPGNFTIAAESFSQVNGYRTHRGNKVFADPPAADTNSAYRQFDPVTTGALYAAFILNYENSEAGDGSDQKFAGLSFLSNQTELAFLAKSRGPLRATASRRTVPRTRRRPSHSTPDLETTTSSSRNTILGRRNSSLEHTTLATRFPRQNLNGV